MDSETPTPQDPSRFSKPKSEPPILDLKATEHQPESVNAEEPARAGQKAAGSQPKPKALRRFPGIGIIGGMIGLSLVALGILGMLGMLGNVYFIYNLAAKITDLDQKLATKAEHGEAVKFDMRLAALEAALAETKAMLDSNAKKSANIDPSVIKRIDDIEAALQSLSGREPIASPVADHRALRLALIMALRDTVRADLPTHHILAALETIGETHPAFAVLKDNLAAPLPSYAALIDEAISEMKADYNKPEITSDPIAVPSRFSTFLSQLITVRPAKTTELAPVATHDIIDPIVDHIVTALEDQHADEALKLIGALPAGERAKFTPLESDIARRARVETALAALLDDALSIITIGDNP